MKQKREKGLYTIKPAEPLVLKESVVIEGVGLTMPVRAAKAKFSALLDFVAAGTAITITSDGKPKAILKPIEASSEQIGFEPAWDLLESVPTQTEGPFAEDLIRSDRDGRGW